MTLVSIVVATIVWLYRIIMTAIRVHYYMMQEVDHQSSAGDRNHQLYDFNVLHRIGVAECLQPENRNIQRATSKWCFVKHLHAMYSFAMVVAVWWEKGLIWRRGVSSVDEYFFVCWGSSVDYLEMILSILTWILRCVFDSCVTESNVKFKGWLCAWGQAQLQDGRVLEILKHHLVKGAAWLSLSRYGQRDAYSDDGPDQRDAINIVNWHRGP